MDKWRAARVRKLQTSNASFVERESFTTQMEKSGESDTDRSDVRVKVYVLSGERVWDDKGTGHVTFDDGENGPLIIVKAEAPEHEGACASVCDSFSALENTPSLAGLILLRSAVLRDTAYQKQQETLIVWSESGSTDLALSFQEATGCERIWRRICEVRACFPVPHLRDFPRIGSGQGSSTGLHRCG